MVRVTNAVASKKRRQRITKLAKGFVGDRGSHRCLTKDAVMKALSYQFIHRKQKKSLMRGLWISRIQVAAKLNGMSYNKFMNGLKKAGCLINRKMLAEIALKDQKSFGEIAGVAKQALSPS